MADGGVSRAEYQELVAELKRQKQVQTQQAIEIMLLKQKAIWEELNRKLSQIRDQSNRLAVEFMNSQIASHQAVVTLTLSGLVMANNEYNGILGLKDAQKFLTADLLYNIATIAIPGLGPIKKGIESWEQTGTKLKKFVAHIGGSASDYYGIITKETADVDDSTLNIAGSSNNIIRAALVKAFRGLGMALVLKDQIIPLVIKAGLNEHQVKKFWDAAGMPTISPSKTGASLCSQEDFDVMVKVFLYDMLRNYTGKHVTFKITDMISRGKYAKTKELDEDGNAIGEFTGMTQATRDAIYARYGTIGWAAMYAGKLRRPAITGYRDMVREWGLAVDTSL